MHDIQLPYDKTKEASILKYAKKIVGKSVETILLINKGELNSRGKGNIGLLLEEQYFRYKTNNESKPDFPEAGLELKTTPLKMTRHGLSPKERLVMNIINFNKEHTLTFYNSSFWTKNKSLLLVFYEYKKNVSYKKYIFKLVDIWKFPKEDTEIIKRDWNIITKKIREGLAHEISEGDTNYLGACIKGATRESSFCKQPFSNKKAPRRAFSLKPKYLKFIVKEFERKQKQRIEDDISDTEKIITGIEELQKVKSFENLVMSKYKPYIGKTVEEIAAQFKDPPNPKAKDYFANISKMILGVRGKKIEEFEKADIILKTIRLNKKGMPKEAISFPTFKYKKIVKEKWTTADLRQRLEKRFFFVVFQFDGNDKLRLRKAFLWNMPYKDIEECKKVWQMTIKRIKNREAENLPKTKDNRICHVRPHGRNKRDTYETHYGEELPKKCFWLNASYIKQVIEDTNFTESQE